MIRVGIHEFIEKFREKIIERVAQDSKPLYRPGQDRKEAYDLIKHIPRRSIASQIDAIGGIVKALRSRDSAILVGEMGLGKAQPVDSPVLTPTGWRTIGNIKPGDSVIAADGKATQVLAVYPQGIRPIYRVTFSDGSTAECDEEHIWAVTTPLRRFRSKTRPELDPSWHYCHVTLKQILKEGLTQTNGNRRWFIPITMPVEFDRSGHRPIHPYLLGALLGDGCLYRNQIHYTTGDLEMIDRLEALLPATCHLKHREGIDWGIIGHSRGRPNTLLEHLRFLRLQGLKSQDKFVPEAYLYAPTEERIALLQGLLDTDGWIIREHNSIGFSSASPKLADAIQQIVQSLGGTARRNLKKTTRLDAHTVTIALPHYIKPFQLQRKAQDYRPRSKYPPARAIIAAEPVSEKEAVCIAINHPSHLYITKDYIVTHNTYVSIAASSALGYSKTLVICPPHLVRKWKREVKLTLPRAHVEIAEKIADIERALRLRREPLFVILSREKAKLGYYWKGHAKTQKDGTLACPKCCTILLDRDEVPLTQEALNKKRRKCKHCQEPLWEADRKGPRRYPLATYLKNKYPRRFDVLLSDECHEFKGAATAQGIALDHLGKAAKKILALTGTLLGGYSSNLFYLLYRVSKEVQKEFKFKDIKRWMELYGVLEKITYISNEEEGRASLKKAQEVRWHERPGISPALIPELLPKTIFLKLSDLNIALPPYREVVHPVDMEEDQKEAYQAFQEDLLSELRVALQQGSRRLLGKYLQALLGYSDSPWVKETIQDGSRVIAESTPLKEDKLYPKEIELLKICQEAKRAGRKTVVYAIHTDTRDLTKRLKRILEENGLKADILRASKVRAKKREEWIQSNRSDVLITHPRNVQTGLDLIDFPEVVWYQQDYSVYILRQASRRSWRIGQTKPVNVHFLFYKTSIQEKAITLNTKKLRAALLTEGDLVEEGLSTGVEEDSLASLAKAIITKSNETVSLESELDKLRILEGERGTISAESEEAQEPPKEIEQTPAPNRPPAVTTERRTPPAAFQEQLRVLRKLREEKAGQKKTREIQNPNQLALF